MMAYAMPLLPRHYFAFRHAIDATCAAASHHYATVIDAAAHSSITIRHYQDYRHNITAT